MCLGRVSSSAAGLLGNEGGGKVTLVSPELGRLAWDPTEPMLEGRRPLRGGGELGGVGECAVSALRLSCTTDSWLPQESQSSEDTGQADAGDCRVGVWLWEATTPVHWGRKGAFRWVLSLGHP